MICLVALQGDVSGISERALFETSAASPKFPGTRTYPCVSKLISESKYQYLTNAMSFDTNETL
jgi:hypothetical protein